MILKSESVMCTAVKKPNAWKMDDREGISYKVEISDGTENIQMACKDADVYSRFVPFRNFEVQIELLQTSFDGRKGVKAQIIEAEEIY